MAARGVRRGLTGLPFELTNSQRTALAEIEANRALKDATGDQAAHAGGPDQDITHTTGPAATETADRAPAIEGAKPGTKPKG